MTTRTLAKKKTPMARISSKAPRKQLKTAGKSTPRADGMKTTHRDQPGNVVPRNIRKYQNVTQPLYGKIPFQNLVREIAEKEKAGIQFHSKAVLALQVGSENYLASLFEAAKLCASHAKRVTVIPEDIFMARNIWDKHP